jgi:striatin 1/3/4
MLIGVMRFLQTEWHRHERDRNAWEIERQEMKARIAALEGAGRRADAQQKSLGKYVKMLEDALQRERKKVKSGDTASEAVKDVKENHIHKTKEQPKRESIVTSWLDQANSYL